MKSQGLPISRSVIFGLIGGIIGAIVMGGAAYMMLVPTSMGSFPFFAAAALVMGVSASAAVGAGWGLHILTGLIVGAIFGGVTGGVRRLNVTTYPRGLGLGVLAGVIVWLVFFLPLMAAAMPSLMSMGSLIGGSFGAHILFGLIMGGVTTALLSMTKGGAFKCEMCGATFKTKDDLMAHSKQHMASPKQFKCETCGATFKSQAELMDHAKKAHPM